MAETTFFFGFWLSPFCASHILYRNRISDLKEPLCWICPHTIYRTLNLTVVWTAASYGKDNHSQLKKRQWWKTEYVLSPLLNVKCNCKVLYVYFILYIITHWCLLLYDHTVGFFLNVCPFYRILIEKIPMWWNHGREVKRNNPTLTSSPKTLPSHSPGPFRE